MVGAVGSFSTSPASASRCQTAGISRASRKASRRVRASSSGSATAGKCPRSPPHCGGDRDGSQRGRCAARHHPPARAPTTINERGRARDSKSRRIPTVADPPGAWCAPPRDPRQARKRPRWSPPPSDPARRFHRIPSDWRELRESPLSDSNRRPLPYHGRARVSRASTDALERVRHPCKHPQYGVYGYHGRDTAEVDLVDAEWTYCTCPPFSFRISRADTSPARAATRMMVPSAFGPGEPGPRL